jgi:multidrug efflux pump subunit AcrB
VSGGPQIPGSLGTPAGLISTFARHPNAANLLMVLLVLFGLFGVARINTQFFPTVEIKTVTISITWAGASAEDVEANILRIIEPEVRFIDGVDKMQSTAREGIGVVSLEFDPATDMQKATADVDAAVKAIAILPADSEAPRISRVAFFDRVANIAVAGDLPEQTLRHYAKQIRDDLIARGIDKIVMTGLRSEELQVEIPERNLRRLDLAVGDVSRIVASNTRDMPSGRTEGILEQQLRALAEFETPAQLGAIEVRSFASGEKVRLGDIASIGYGFEDGQAQGFSGGMRAIELQVQRAPTADTLRTAAILDQYLAELEPVLPPGLSVHKYQVASDALMERLMLLVRNGLSGLLLVVAVLFVFLNSRIAFWVAAGIPVATLATIGIMMLFGQSINMVTLFGLIMMLGIIVDDAIVVGEHTATRFELGDSPIEAAENGAGRMMTPVIAAMTTTAAAFGPIAMIGDALGQIIGVLPIVVISVLIASTIECFFILPGHLAHALAPRRASGWSHVRHLAVSLAVAAAILAISQRSAVDADAASLSSQVAALRGNLPAPLFLAVIAVASFLAGALFEGALALWRRFLGKDKAPQTDGDGWFRSTFDAGFDWFRSRPFAAVVSLAYRWRYVTVALALASMMTMAIGLVAGGRVGFVFFPSPEAETLQARIEFNAGLPEERAREILGEVEASLAAMQEELSPQSPLVSAVFAVLGKAGRDTGDNLAEMTVQLTASERRDVRTPQIVRAWRQRLPELPGVKRISIFENRGGPPGRDLHLELTGGDAPTLKKAANEIIELVSAVPGSSGVADDLPYGKPELVMRLTPRGSALGFSVEEVGRQVRDAFEGAIPRRFALEDEEIAVRIRRIANAQGGGAIRDFELRSPAGEFVPLSEVVELEEKQGFAVIRRLDGRTIASITGDLDTNVATTEQANSILTSGAMPAIAARYGLDWRFAGRAEERQRAFKDIGIGAALALAVIYIILAWVVSGYWRPLAIIAMIPFGVVGAIFGHWVMGFQVTMMSMAALLGLAGILVNDAIVLVSRLDERLAEGETLAEAAVGASCDRLRAVLLTSLTTIGGLLPLLFEKSVQAQFIMPMAVSIVFGLGFATLLVLFLVPAYVGIGDDIVRLIGAVFGNRRHRTQPAE